MWKVCNYYIQGPDQGGNSTRWMYHNDHNGYYSTCVRFDYALIVGSGELAAMVALAKEFTSFGHQNVQIMYVPSGKIYNQFGEILPVLVITGLTAIHQGNGVVKVSWNQDRAGTVRLTYNGHNLGQKEGVAGANSSLFADIPIGTHEFCVVAV